MQEQAEQYQKLNAFSRRPCATQIASYLVIVTINIIFWVAVQDKFLNQGRRFCMVVLFSMSLVVLLIVGFITSYLDPSDPILKQQCGTGKPMSSKFNFDKYLYCQHCRSYVCASSRHCKQCDRCITKFDHHCIWINSCIGEINYRPFFAMICAAFIHLFLFILSLGLLWGENNWQMYIFQIILSWILGVVVLIFIFLLLGLIILHFYLIRNNLTTFDYILSKKTLEERKKFTNIIRVKIEDNKDQEEPMRKHKTNQKNQNIKTQNQLPLPSAFQEISNRLQEDKSDIPSFECFKQKKQKKSPPVLVTGQNFESIIIEKTKDRKDQQSISRVIKKHQSLKLLVGDSIDIKTRKDSLHELSPKIKKRKPSIKANIAKIDDFIYYMREQDKLRKSQYN